MINKKKMILYLVLFTILLSGCWDYEDINNRSITLSIGVDQMEDKVILTGEIAKLVSSSNMATVSGVYQFVASGKNFEEARYDLDYQIATKEFPGGVIALAFSKKYAEEKGIEAYVNRYNFSLGYRPSALVVISEHNTQELFQKKVLNNISTGHSIEDIIRHLEKDGFTIYTTVQDIRKNISFRGLGFVIPYIKREKDIIKYLGLAVMKDSKFIGVVDADNSRGIIYLTAENPSYTVAIPHPQNKSNLISIKTKLKNRKITTNYDENQIYINVKLELSSSLIYEYIREPISDEAVKEIESNIEDMIKKEVVSSIERSQKEFKCDFFEFGRYFKADNSKMFEIINWEEEYPNAIVDVEVDSKVINYNFLNTKSKNYKWRVD